MKSGKIEADLEGASFSGIKKLDPLARKMPAPDGKMREKGYTINQNWPILAKDDGHW